jgi:glycosyltransferase involved in cell wall biosynthesis
MKILQVVSSFPPAYSYGGAVKVSYEISKELVKKGHEVTVYTTDAYDENSRLKFDKNPVYMEGIKVYHFRNLSNVLCKMNFPIALEMYTYLRKNIQDFDIVHIHEYRSFQTIFAQHFAVKYRVPYILQAHGSTPLILGKIKLKKIYDSFFGYSILKKASRLISLSNAEVEQYIKMKAEPSKIFLIPNGIEINSNVDLPEPGVFRKKYNLSNKHCILFLGRLHERKGIDFLIRSFAELIKDIDDAVLILAGPDDGYKNKAKEQVYELNLEEKVIFTGYMEPADKISAYLDADILVYPSFFEIFGLVPFEAIMYDTPVIVTDDCGCGEFIKKANCGYLVKYGDLTDLKYKMKLILENPDIGSKFVENGQKYITNNLTWPLICKKIERLYENCIYKV